MIILKSSHELKMMREAGRISAQALRVAGEAVRPGMSTYELDRIIHDFITKSGAQPGFLNLYGFPASACISVNNEVIHGIPSKHKILQEGDIVSVDLGAKIGGYNGDNAATFPVGKISDEAQRLLDVTRESLYEGIKAAQVGGRVGDIGHAVQSYVEQHGYSVVRDYVGHGVGKDMHEDPSVPNYGTPGRGARLAAGMTIAIEPMVNQGREQVKVLSNDWTVVTVDGKLSAHFEHTIAITPNGPVILTAE